MGCPSTEQIGITFNSLINTPLGALTGVIGVESGDGYASNFSIRLFEKNSTAITLGKEKVYTASTLTKTIRHKSMLAAGSIVRRPSPPAKLSAPFNTPLSLNNAQGESDALSF